MFPNQAETLRRLLSLSSDDEAFSPATAGSMLGSGPSTPTGPAAAASSSDNHAAGAETGSRYKQVTRAYSCPKEFSRSGAGAAAAGVSLRRAHSNLEGVPSRLDVEAATAPGFPASLLAVPGPAAACRRWA
jgi:hypothetical protein